MELVFEKIFRFHMIKTINIVIKNVIPFSHGKAAEIQHLQETIAVTNAIMRIR
jgi:hypothetical protein